MTTVIQEEMLPQCVRRPSINDKAVRDAAVEIALSAVKGWMQNGMTEHEEEDARRILNDELWSSDAFEIAKAFDRAGWEVDAELVAILHEEDDAVCRAHRKAVREWVQAVRPQPKLAIGAAVITPDSKRSSGEVVRIYEDEATYLVFVESLGHVREGMGTHGCIYAWEDVEAAS